MTGWYLKAVEYFDNRKGRWAYVSTNSICQGEPTAKLYDPVAMPDD